MPDTESSGVLTLETQITERYDLLLSQTQLAQLLGRTTGGLRYEPTDPRLKELVNGLDSYRDKERRRYIHLIDGGVSDNLGVRSAYERVHILGGAKQASKLLLGRTPPIIAMVVVNAETHPDRPMDLSRKSPGTSVVLGALTDTQLQRYNVESIALMRNSLKQWSDELSTPDQPVTPYFIQLDFESIADPETRVLFNNVATSLALPAEEVDNLVEAGHRLLRKSPEFQDLMAQIRSLDKKDHARTADNMR